MSTHLNDFTPPSEGELVAVDVDGTVVAVTVIEGELHAFEDTCPHAGCSLADGELEGSTVTCACHFARFDVRSGAVLGGPAPSGVGTWPAKLTNGRLELGERQEAAPVAADAPEPAAPNKNPDVAVLVQREHDAFRRQFEALKDATDPETDWTSLVEVLEVHARAEETLLYPMLVGAADETTDGAERAVRDHNEIREAVDRAQQQEAGSESWWEAVREAHRVTEDHLAEEERDLLPDVRDALDPERRESLGRQWVAFHEKHQGAQGLTGEAVDPAEVMARGG